MAAAPRLDPVARLRRAPVPPGQRGCHPRRWLRRPAPRSPPPRLPLPRWRVRYRVREAAPHQRMLGACSGRTSGIAVEAGAASVGSAGGAGLSAGEFGGSAATAGVSGDGASPIAAASGVAPSSWLSHRPRRRRLRPVAPPRGSRLGRFRAAIHPVAEGAQDRGEVLARGASQRGHCVGDRETAPGDGAWRLRRGCAFAPRQSRANQISKALQNIHANGTVAAEPITGDPVEHCVDLAIGRN